MGARGSEHPHEITKNIGFLSSACPDPLKSHKATSKHSMLGRHWPDSETSFQAGR